MTQPETISTTSRQLDELCLPARTRLSAAEVKRQLTEALREAYPNISPEDVLSFKESGDRLTIIVREPDDPQVREIEVLTNSTYTT